MRLAVEAYRVTHGTYPEHLTALIESGLVASEAIQRGDTPLWRYELVPDHTAYVLAPAPAPERHR